jgi:carbohydrate-selective porin OprB
LFSTFLALVCLMLSFLTPLRAADREMGPNATPAAVTVPATGDAEKTDIAASPASAGATETSSSSPPASPSPPEPAASPPVVVESSMTMDVSRNMRGGLESRGAAVRHLTQVGLRVDSRSLGWRGGTIYLGLQEHAGRPGGLFVGDAQGFSNIDAERRTHVGEFWFEQVFSEGKLRIKAGKVDANTEFALVENAGNFLNSSMGYSPTILVMPTYPNARLGFNAFVAPTERFYAGLGVYDVAGGGFMPIGEVGARWKSGKTQLPGRLGFGLWHYTGNLERFQGGSKAGTTGFFVVCDQRLWRERSEDHEDSQGLGVFFQFGSADADVSEITRHLGGGVEWTGAIPGRNADAIGFGATHVKFTSRPEAGFEKSSELALETFYKIQVTPWLSIAPDVQYIRTPGGAASPGHALAGTVRVTVDLGSFLKRSGKAALKSLR